MGLTAATHPR